MKHNEIPLGLWWPALVCALPQAHRCHSYPPLGQRNNLVDYKFHRYCLKVTFDNALQSKLLPSKSEGSLSNHFASIFDEQAGGSDMSETLRV
ncbi:hypothetical protein AVEN_10291-1 [Araneus ventricosus]|uniref:Secreted protein n=1 Tax=Araneus ventricosus TaxID=182803 RepID=A0A4Y2K5C1_ARAVE|nr:hypothetical protein AVEN_10291-1 [Araneus ventricosus]